MKILISLTYYLPNISGVTIYAQILSEFLAKDHQVTILTSRFDRKLPHKEIVNNTLIKRIWSPIKISKGILVPFFPFYSFIEVLKTDLIICHLPQLESVFLAFWGKILRKPIILVHHCEFATSAGTINKIIKTVTFPFHLITYTLADTVVAYTKDYADHSLFLKKFQNKTTYILPPIILAKKERSEVRRIEKRVKKDKNTKLIGFVGRIGWEKGIDILLKSIPFIKKGIVNFKIVLVGPYQSVIGDKTYDKLKPLIEKYKQNIALIGPIKHERLINYYSCFNCLVLPSTDNLESFGIVQPEAMICGCPVVASNLPGVRVPIKLTGMGKVFSVGNYRELADTITYVLKNRKSLTKLEKIAKKKFNRSNFFNMWIKIILK